MGPKNSQLKNGNILENANGVLIKNEKIPT
jgi:hypothetical protein